MTAAEEGVLLLCCQLGDPESRPLTTAQFRELGRRVRTSCMGGNPLAELSAAELRSLGYDESQVNRILALLSRTSRLRDYIARGQALGIHPLTRLSPAYPDRLRQMGQEASTPVLFYRGDGSLLRRPAVAVVGSRRLLPENEAFARQAGRLAAQEGLVLVSGGAQGADLTAQNACLEHGGSCVIFVADPLTAHPPQANTLYLSEAGYDCPFSPARALHRTGLIHMLGEKTLAAQCCFGSGGTWQGCLENLRHRWSELYVFADGSPAMAALEERGAVPVHRLERLQALVPSQFNLFDSP